MSDALTQAGAVPPKQSNFAPLHTDEIFTGLWTNRNPLRDAATPYLYRKFYAASRYDAMIAGQNVEVSPRLTAMRRPGTSKFNTQSFSEAINTFYPFRIFDPVTGIETIIIIGDTPTGVYDVTPPSTKTLLFTKAAGAGQTSFQSVGNTLYMGDGVDLKKYVWSPAWQALHAFSLGSTIIDSNGNLQAATSSLVNNIFNVAVTNNVLTIQTSTNFSIGSLLGLLGLQINFLNLATATFLNGQSVIILTAVNGVSHATITAAFTHANYGPAADSGQIWSNFSKQGGSGASVPTWGTNPGDITFDVGLQWTNKGPALQNWGIVEPLSPPSVANTPSTNLGTGWAASTYFWPSQTIIDSNGNIQKLTTPGTTNAGVPVWNVALNGTTADGTAVWTNQGTATRATNTAYALGQFISVTYTVTKTVKRHDPETGQNYYDTITLGPYTSNFIVATAGTTSTTATGLLAWPNGNGSQITDGTVVWKNIGTTIVRTAPANSNTNISNSTIVTNVQQIVDSNGNFQNVIGGGLTGVAHPTWSTTLGAVTTDGSAPAIVNWQEAGPATAAGTGAWGYAYAWKNSVTGHVSTASPMSTPIVLAASSYIAVSGNGSPDPQVDTIEVYRTVQGTNAGTTGGTLFFLADIPAPTGGGMWTFSDTTPDPPNPGSTLNNLILADVTGTNAPPEAGLIGLTYHLNRIWGIVNEFAFYGQAPNASIGVAAESFPGINFFQMPDNLTKLWPNTLGLMFYAVKGLFLSPGTTAAGLPLQPVAFNDDLGLGSVNCFTVNGSTPIIFSFDKQAVSMDPSAGFSRVGFPIEDLLQSFSSTASYITWNTKGPDQALYLANGAGTCYRMMLTPAPESGGYTWSPAGIIAGTKCVQSIESSPGVTDLLFGPDAGGGFILKRDISVSQDNGVSYPADFTVGSLVLAPSGKCAEVEWVTTEALAIGSRVTVSLLPDEVSGVFSPLSENVNDPPYLGAPTSLYSDRWYLSSFSKPGWMKHLQIKFAWPTENAANELLTYTIYGTIHDEM